MSWLNLSAAVTKAIKANAQLEISAEDLQNTLTSIADTVGANATFAGIAIPTTNPGTTNSSVFYVAVQAGTYTYFGNYKLVDKLVVFSKSGSSWAVTEISPNYAYTVNAITEEEETRENLVENINWEDIDLDFNTRRAFATSGVGAAAFYKVWYNSKVVGTLQMFSDANAHQITQVLTTNYILGEDNTTLSEHTDTAIHTYRRQCGTSSAPVTNSSAVWSDWEGQVTQETGNSESLVMSQKAISEEFNAINEKNIVFEDILFGLESLEVDPSQRYVGIMRSASYNYSWSEIGTSDTHRYFAFEISKYRGKHITEVSGKSWAYAWLKSHRPINDEIPDFCAGYAERFVGQIVNEEVPSDANFLYILCDSSPYPEFSFAEEKDSLISRVDDISETTTTLYKTVCSGEDSLIIPEFEDGDIYIRENGTQSSYENFKITKPIFLSAGQKIEVNATFGANTCALAKVAKEDYTFPVEVVKINSTKGNYTYQYEALKDCFILASFQYTQPYQIKIIEKSITDKVTSLLPLLDQSYILQSDKVVIVDENGSGDYTSLQEAIYDTSDYNNSDNARTILVMPGTYTMDEYNRGSSMYDDKWASYRNLSIIGVNRTKCIVRNSNGKYIPGAEGVDNACIKMTGNCYIANLTIISSDDDFNGTEEERRSYCIHVDRLAADNTHFIIQNCKLVNNHHSCVGFGLKQGNFILELIGCECTSTLKNNINQYGTLFGHDIDDNSNGQLIVRDCIITNTNAPYGVYISSKYESHTSAKLQRNVFEVQGNGLFLSDNVTLSSNSCLNNLDNLNM